MDSHSIEVNLEFTPNPDTLKYVTSLTLLPSGVANFIQASDAVGKSPLAERLFAFPDVSAIMIGKNFVTLTVRNQDNLQELHPKIVESIRSFLAEGTAPVTALPSSAPSAQLSEIERKIVEILEAEIKPAVAMDGGDISFEKYEDGFVYLRMQGSCAGCPSSMMTLKMGVENRLRESIPEIQEVIPV